jgi:S1-C subfamily serine protease
MGKRKRPTLILGLALTVASWIHGFPASAQEPAGVGAGRALETARALENSLTAAIARAEKSVVAIARVRKERPGETFGLELRPDPFGRRLAPAVSPGPTDPDFVPNDYATGVIIDRQGLILTAYHALSAESEYYVTTPERRIYRATVKGADPRSDLAVLAIEAGGLPAITFGEGGELKKGQIVIALGNPYAIGRDGQASASWGIISNLARKAPPIPEDGDPSATRTLHQFGTLIQTDAKLSLGTSGGALVNLRGEMVGLTVALAATAGYEQSAGYAIPLDATFRRVIDTLKEGREVEYGFLGIRPVNLPAAEVLSGKQGVKVQSVVPGTPAYRYGLQTDDVITAVGGMRVLDADALMLELGRMPADSSARFSVLRNGRPLDVEVVLAKYPVTGKKVITRLVPSWRGMRVDFTTAIASPEGAAPPSYFFGEGVIVTDVEQGKPAWLSGIRPGMRISQVDATPVSSPKQFRAAVAGKAGPVQLRLVAGSEGAAESVRTVGPGG